MRYIFIAPKCVTSLNQLPFHNIKPGPLHAAKLFARNIFHCFCGASMPSFIIIVLVLGG